MNPNVLCRYSCETEKVYHVTILHSMYIMLPVQMKIKIYIISGAYYYINIALREIKMWIKKEDYL